MRRKGMTGRVWKEWYDEGEKCLERGRKRIKENVRKP